VVLNPANVNYSAKDIRNIMRVCAHAGVTNDRWIFIGSQVIPGGHYFVGSVSVDEEETVTNVHDVEYRSILLSAKYWNADTQEEGTSSKQFAIMRIDTLKVWHVTFEGDTITFRHYPGMTYSEAENLIDLLFTKTCVFNSDSRDHFPRDEIRSITDIKKVGRWYFVTFESGYKRHDISCEIIKGRL
jgi:hypothetical protein